MKAMKKIVFLLLLSSQLVIAQKKQAVTATVSPVVSGPMLGPIELRSAVIWLEVDPMVKKLAIQWWKKGSPVTQAKTKQYNGALGNDFNPVKIEIGGLEVFSTYQYQFVIDGKAAAATMGEFTTKELWNWRKPAPDFSFLTGSCLYINQPEYDRPGRPYGGDSSIFEVMAKVPASFMLWLGDNWYTREVDFFSKWGMWYRPSFDRSRPIMQPLLKAMSHFAIWDDHDYGPNDSDGSFVLKRTSKEVFDNYWCNPSSGYNGEGTYTKINHNDVDIFMLDDRWWRTNDAISDSLNGQPNKEKTMFGKQQMDWLKSALSQSKTNGAITFRIIATGSQMLNPVTPYDCFNQFPAEYADFMNFLKEEKIPGVLFLTGDRHHTEVIKVERDGAYPLYDVTASPLTSGTHKFSGPEKNNPYRVMGIDELKNFGKVSVSGKRNERVMTFEFFGTKGDKLGEWSVSEKELKFPRGKSGE
jgi:alkaline phosphatase D